MTALVTLFFIAVIPIDCKITNFPYTCYYIGLDKLQKCMNLYQNFEA